MVEFHNEVNYFRRITEIMDQILERLLGHIVGLEDFRDVLQDGLRIGSN